MWKNEMKTKKEKVKVTVKEIWMTEKLVEQEKLRMEQVMMKQKAQEKTVSHWQLGFSSASSSDSVLLLWLSHPTDTKALQQRSTSALSLSSAQKTDLPSCWLRILLLQKSQASPCSLPQAC